MIRFQGHAAVFDVVDRAGDVVRRGAFAEAGPVALLWQHRGAPVGEICAIGEDATGLWIEAEVVDPEVARLVRGGALRGLSVGYRATAGFAVPREIDAVIDATLKAISPIRGIANVVKVGSAGYRKLVTTGGTPSGWAAETAARPETASPTFVEIAPSMGELAATPGATIRVMASGPGDVSGAAETTATITGASILPPAPVGLTVTPTDDGGAMLKWARRSRVGWRWIDAVDAPLGEEREVYRVTVVPATGAARTIETDVPETMLTAAERSGGPIAIGIRQRGANGESPVLAATI